MELRTAAWYGDREISLRTPPSWSTTVLEPTLGAPLDEREIRTRLESPVGQPPLRELCAGKRRPLVIVDDLNRPTPASQVIPFVLQHFEEAGIPPEAVTILMAPGTHGQPPEGALEKKIGEQATRSCRARVHDCNGRLVSLGRTSFDTPVLVPREVAESDLVVGVGGIYPNHTGGFGGGSKLALGVLGFRSIATLHYRHGTQGWGSPGTQSPFRRDLDEIARMIGLTTTVSLGTDAERNVVELVCGDHHEYFPRLVEERRSTFRVPGPGAARVVISNAYPIDASLTFAWMKGMLPLQRAAPGASRIAVAACPEGLGFHGLFPLMNPPRSLGPRRLRVRLDMERRHPRALARKAVVRLARTATRRRSPPPDPEPDGNPIWLHCPDPDGARRLPAEVPQLRVTTSWDEVLAGVEEEQAGGGRLEAVVYPCAPLQVLD